jgi:hypothetical protein
MVKKKTQPVQETVNPDHEALIELLKFTPRTYTIQMWGYGVEILFSPLASKHHTPAFWVLRVMVRGYSVLNISKVAGHDFNYRAYGHGFNV